MPPGGVFPGLLVRTSFGALKRFGRPSSEAARADTADEVRLARTTVRLRDSLAISFS